MLKIRTFILALSLTPLLAISWQLPGQSQTSVSVGTGGSESGAGNIGSNVINFDGSPSPVQKTADGQIVRVKFGQFKPIDPQVANRANSAAASIPALTNLSKESLTNAGVNPAFANSFSSIIVKSGEVNKVNAYQLNAAIIEHNQIVESGSPVINSPEFVGASNALRALREALRPDFP
ncbi:hypothetical protein MEO93_21825 [Dolichospermum sp. ST_sed3]|nr:hypothetical protein [Dolichospermum sp. ST_sed6]MDD1442945.1 hypothetical protein [Dolichospermum sp. ST_sed3]MDD1462702.1 hypothetical protein [Dolichospermum sp. ST_sed2]MDD1473867.1 hypothetical protein [Dolichospermum sp. ST_sed4]